MPIFAFQPDANVKTSVIVLQKGVVHPPDQVTEFVFLGSAGLKVSKNLVRPQPTHASIVEWAVRVVGGEKDVPTPPRPSRNDPPVRISSRCVGMEDWSVGTHMPWDMPSSKNLLHQASKLVDSWGAGAVYNCDTIRKQRATLEAAPKERLPVSISVAFAKKLDNAAVVSRRSVPETFGATWIAVEASDFVLGKLEHGNSLVVSGKKI